MWLRLALNLLSLLLFSACSPSEEGAADKLNSLSYYYHYRDIDSTEHYARQVLAVPSCTDGQRAEALNHLAFCALIRMQYDRADSLLADALAVSDNQVELLITEVQFMRLCQRRSQNRAFYEHREQATGYLRRIKEERTALSPHLQRRMVYAESELAIVNSAYYYYVGLERQCIDAIRQLDTDATRRDTAQYLNYLYNVGAGGILTEGTHEEINNEEMDYLHRCLTIAQRCNYPYFEAQAHEGMAEHTGDVGEAERALYLFQQYGDVYQIAGAYRTLASCYHAAGDDAAALHYLQLALADSAISQAPDLVASIREQLSVAYSALDDKRRSDYNRNIYIDLQEQTRQDRELEARAGLLDRAVRQLNAMLLAVVVAIVLLVLLLWLFNRLNRKSKNDSQLDDLLEQKNEELAEARLRVAKNERRHLEQRAKVSLAMSILPLIDRIRHAITSSASSQMEYVCELTDNINQQNNLLTQWIQLRQGELSLHIESFPLQRLFDMVARSQSAFAMKGLTLDVQPTGATVKADRVLTLFMLNTLADNARKFTDRGGRIEVSASELADSVEISVSDTGCGMTADQLAHVFDAKPIIDDTAQRSHGFGLMNCRGIIEKYRKLSQLFSVCLLSAESEPGKGTRFFFRLPKGVVRLLVIGCWLFSQGAWADSQQPLDRAHIYADSAYFCNVNGAYERTLVFADSCRQCLNAHYLSKHPEGRLLMQADAADGVLPAEILWLRQGEETNYQIVLDIRNESAVAALALHRWDLYIYNNKVYTQLFKELSADNTLADYCRTMQQSQTNKRIAVILLLLLLVMLLPAYYILYYRQRLYNRFRHEHMQQSNIELVDDELRRCELENANLHVANAVLDNCLSTLKHETMYYPSRIRQLIDSRQIESLGEVAAYYRELYAILIQQAIGQVERIKLHVRPIELYGQCVLGDENLLHYLFELVRGTITAEARDEKYVVCRVALKTPLSTIDNLLVRQIVRDHGEATNRRACGIIVEEQQVIITLPRYNGKL